MLESLKVEAEAHGYDVTFINKNVGSRSTTYLQHCLYRQVDGVIVACVNFTDPQVLEPIHSDLPVVTIDHVFQQPPVGDLRQCPRCGGPHALCI